MAWDVEFCTGVEMVKYHGKTAATVIRIRSVTAATGIVCAAISQEHQGMNLFALGTHALTKVVCHR